MSCITKNQHFIKSRDAASYMEKARDTILEETIKIINETPSLWIDIMPKGDWELGKGFTQQQKYYEPSYIEAHTTWRNMAELDRDGKLCSLCPEVIEFGSSMKSFDLEETSFRGPDICFPAIISLQDYEMEMMRQYDELAAVGPFKLENKYRDSHIYFSSRKYLAVAGNPNAYHMEYFPDPTGQKVSTAHQGYYDLIYSYFLAQGGYAAGNNMGSDNGMPTFLAIEDFEVTDKVLFSDPEARADVRYSRMNNELITRFHDGVKWKGWMHMNDAQSPRFDFIGGEWVRRPYFTKVQRSIGAGRDPNPDYEKSEFTLVIFIANKKGPKALSVPELTSAGGNTSFNRLHSNFELEWKNESTNCDNVRKQQAYWLATMMQAINPGQCKFVACMMFARDTASLPYIPPKRGYDATIPEAPFSPAPSAAVCCICANTCCMSEADFACEAFTPADTNYPNGLRLTPVMLPDGVAVGDTVTLESVDGVTFTVLAYDDVTFALDLGYTGDVVDCADIQSEWVISVPEAAPSASVCYPLTLNDAFIQTWSDGTLSNRDDVLLDSTGDYASLAAALNTSITKNVFTAYDGGVRYTGFDTGSLEDMTLSDATTVAPVDCPPASDCDC